MPKKKKEKKPKKDKSQIFLKHQLRLIVRSKKEIFNMHEFKEKE